METMIQTKKISLRIPPDLLEEVDGQAKTLHRSRSWVLVYRIQQGNFKILPFAIENPESVPGLTVIPAPERKPRRKS
jgi:hypothetical protein